MSNEHQFLIQYRTASGSPALGLESGGVFKPLGDKSLDWLLSGEGDARNVADLAAALERTALQPIDAASVTAQAPVGQQEIWASGVTYKRSEEAREAESNNSTIYTRVYSATRPELFFKAMGYDAVGGGEDVGIRYDATLVCARAGTGGGAEPSHGCGGFHHRQRHEFAGHRGRESAVSAAG